MPALQRVVITPAFDTLVMVVVLLNTGLLACDRWPLAENLSTAEALGGGISWAMDPALCNRLLPQIMEQTELEKYSSYLFPMPTFIDCAIIKQIIRRAMASWAAANHNVRFFEVTSLCEHGVGNNYAPPSYYNFTGAPSAPPISPLPPAPPPTNPPPPNHLRKYRGALPSTKIITT